MRVHPFRCLRLLVFLLAAALTVPALAVVAAAPALAVNAAPPNVVVVRVGDGTAALTNSSTAVFLDEYAPDGTLVRSTPLPSAASGSNRPLTVSGSATSEGALAQSSDGRYLTLAGYGTAPGLASVGSTPASTTPRVVARVDAGGAIDTTTAVTDAYSANNVRGAVTDDGGRFWITGTPSGVRYTTLGGSTTTQLAATPTNTRTVNIADGQLYISSGSSPFVGVSRVGNGLPTTAGQTATLVAGTPSPYAFVFLDRSTTVAGVDSLYVADDSSSGGIFKFSFDGTTWTSRGSFKPATSSARGLTGALQADGTVGLVATTTTGTGSIVAVTDTAAFDANITATGTTLATATNNTAFRGIAFAPQAPAAAPTITGQPQDATISPGATATLSVTATGTAPLSYQWYQGDISHPVTGATNPTFTTPALTATTSYFVRVSNSAGFVDSRTATVTVNQAAAPSITAQPQDVTISSGATTTLSVTANGTAPLSYQWYQGSSGDTTTPINGATNASFTTSALTATTTYWVRVTNSAGTVDSRTATVTVTPNNTAPTISPTPVDALGLTLGDPDNPPALRTVTIGDTETTPDALTVTVTSSNSGVATGSTTGTGATRTLTVTPVGVGRATLTVTVSDGVLSTSTTIQVGVSAALPAGTLNYYGASDASSADDLGGGAMVVGDDETNQLRIYDSTHSRYPAQSIDLRALGLALRDSDLTREIDIEASARTGDTIYWLGSQGQNKDNKTRLNRQELFATTVSGTGTSATFSLAGSYQHLRDDMITWDQTSGHGLGANALGLAAAATRAPEGDGAGGPTGFNIEGAELSPDGRTLYVAFRGPLVGDKALVVPVTNIAALVTANPTTGVTATFGSPLLWDLGGRGIREIRRNASNSYLLIAGPTGGGTGAAGEFRFYSWNGDPARQPLLRAGSLDQVAGPGQPESIVSVPDPLLGSSTVQVLTDSGDTAFYGDGVIAKDLAGPDLALRKATSALVTVGAPPVCSTVPVSVGSVQGTTDVSPRSGQTVTVRGTVVAGYEGASPALKGFYLQDAGDGDNATSDGIFVFDNGADLVANGAVVSVTGPVSEFQGQTQITPAAGGVESCGRQAVVTPTDITLPRATAADLEPYEGMLVRLHQTATVTESFQLGRFGQVVVSSGGKLQQPTSVLRATDTAAVAAKQAANNLNRLIIDDATQAQNPDPIVFGRGGRPLSASNTLRGGDTVTNPIGVLTYTWAGNAASGNAYRLRPVGALGGSAVFDPTNPRPDAPPAVGTGGVHVASANLSNFFNTFSGCTFGLGGPAADCRGAENAGEYQRQLDKEVASLSFLGADVVGFMEVENDGYGPASAVQALVDALNSKDGAGTWAFVNPDAATGVTNVAGADAIKAGVLYKTAKVAPVVGDTLVDQNSVFERRPVAQTFQTPTGARFTVVANHFKSKGSCPASGPDTDQGDGQSCWNAHRTDQANELARWLRDIVIPQAGDPDVFIVGDLNSYAGEDPIAALESAGYTNLAKSDGGPDAYSYVFDGQWGYLDYVMATGSLLPQVTGAGDAHHNADEPSVLDYNTNFKSAGQITSLYAPDRFRTSDHDPVLVGLNPLNAPPTAVADAYTTAEDTPLTVSVPGVLGNDTDPERDPLTAVVGGGPAHGAVTLNLDGSFTYTPAPNFAGTDTFTYTAHDATTASAPATVTITVTPVNDPPVAVDDTATTPEDIAVDIPVVGNDTDVDTPNAGLRAVSVAGATGGTATLLSDGRTVRFTPAPNANGANTPGGFSFTYKTNDGALDSANTATVRITVTAVNDAPVLDPIPAQNVRWGNLLTFTAHASDVDVPADTLTYSLVNAPAGVSVNPTTGAVSFTPTSAQVGVVTFKVRVTDGGSPNLFADAPVTVTVDKRPTRLVYSGDSAAQFSDPAAVRATLTDDGGQGLQGQVVPTRTVAFGIGAQNAAAATNPAGLAQTTVTLNQPAGSPGVSSTFAGDGLYLAGSDADPFTITAENAAVAYTGPQGVTTNNPVELSGRVTEAADAHLGNRVDATQLRFTVRRTIDNAVAGSCTAPVNSTGLGSGTGRCPVSLATGNYRVTVELVGNGFYTAPAAQSSPILPLIVIRLPALR